MNTILEVAIGLFFVFLLFSLLASAVNEAIFGHLTHLRSRVLEDCLHAILSKQARGFTVWRWLRRGFKAPPRRSEVGTFSEELLEHPLIQGLVVGSCRCPAYLPAETFADALVGTVLNLGSAQGSPPSSSGFDQFSMTEFAEAVNNLSDDHAKRVLSSVLAGAKDLTEARQKLGTWFDNSMQRVSGTYKRFSQFWLYVWASLIVICLNLDTLEITSRLLTDAQFRSELASGGIRFLDQADSTNAFAGPQNNAPSPTAGNMGLATQNSSGLRAASPAELLQEIGKLNLPLGWGTCTTNAATNSVIGWIITKLPKLEQSAGPIITNSATYMLANGALSFAGSYPDSKEAWRLKLIGLLISIAAISQGAPFWFDLLNKVANLRAAGRPPESTQP